MARALTIGCALALTGCSLFGGRGADRPRPPALVSWRDVATPADRERLRNWRTTWVDALAHARAAGFGQRIAGEGILLDPDAAIAGPIPPEGEYRCRVIKLGTQIAGGSAYTSHRPFACRIVAQGALLSLVKLDGSQRPAGLLYPDDTTRMIFLGAMVLGDEIRAMDYGRDAQRDMIGAFERIGPWRWRLVLPAPRWESLIDVVELVPAT